MKIFYEKKLLGLLSLFILTLVILSACSTSNAQFNKGSLPSGAVQKEIYEIQGASHQSQLNGEAVKEVDGIVTKKVDSFVDSSWLGEKGNGFYMQEINPDNNNATSEAIYVLTDELAKVDIGDKVTIAGNVTEYRIKRDGAFWYNQSEQLTTTAIAETKIELNSEGNTLPEPILLGTDRMIPTDIINDDQLSDFEPTTDGLDFYETLEGMRVKIENPVAVGPTSYGETSILANNGNNASGDRTPYGGITITASDLNPERITVKGLGVDVHTGAQFSKAVTGVVAYDKSKYMVLNSADGFNPTNDLPTQSNITTEFTKESNKLRIASYNVENLNPQSGSMSDIAGSIANNLKAPDIVGLVEIQDNNGETDDGTVAANQTYETLISEIATVGGPTYKYTSIAPENNQDGGAPGANIRVGFLYNPNRVTFNGTEGEATDKATTAVDVEGLGRSASLSINPGRVYPNDSAFDGSRKPLAAQFKFNGEKVFVIASHLSSKGGDDPLYGSQQPPVFNSAEDERIPQAKKINQFVNEILTANSRANVVVLGDMNDFEFSTALDELAGNELIRMINKLPKQERFTYIHAGNSQVLDHILVSNNLETDTNFDAINLNSIYNYQNQISDHDPVMVEITVDN